MIRVWCTNGVQAVELRTHAQYSPDVPQDLTNRATVLLVEAQVTVVPEKTS